MTTLTLQTPASARTIRQALQALFKSQSILSAYKIPQIKTYQNLDGRIIKSNTNLLILQLGPKREISGHKICDQILKERSESMFSFESSSVVRG